jgi:hypothetical protein
MTSSSLRERVLSALPFQSPGKTQRPSNEYAAILKRSLAGELTASENAIKKAFELELVHRVDDEMLVRFRHRSPRHVALVPLPPTGGISVLFAAACESLVVCQSLDAAAAVVERACAKRL